MKRLLFVALALALGLGYATAQNITRSLQGAQDPRGPVGLDTSNSAYFPGHINAFGQQTAAPSPSTCGSGLETGVVTAGSTDVAGIITPQSSACTIVFGSPFNQAPACVAMITSLTAGQASASSMTITPATTNFVLAQAQSGSAVTYICIGNK